MSIEHTETRKSADAEGDRVSMLDEALWARFDQSDSLGEAARIWLALQIRQIGRVEGGAVVVDAGPEGFAPVARWPAERPPHPNLMKAIEAALDKEAPAVTGEAAIAMPLTVDGELIGAVGLLLSSAPAQPTEIIRQLRWGMGWLAEAARSAMMTSASEDRKRMAALLDLTGAVLDAESFKGACLAAMNLLARETGCVVAGVGFAHKRGVRLEALSDVSDFRLNTGRTRAIEGALVEAADQEGSVLYPPRPDQPFMVDLAHKELHVGANLGELLTIPMFDRDGVTGALHLQKSAGERFGTSDILLAEGAAAALGPILLEKRLVDRSAWRVCRDATGAQLRRLFGPRYVVRKIVLLLLLGLVVFLSVAKGDFRVQAEAEVQGRLIRSISAPFDGNIESQFARAGDNVKAGDLLAKLDERDLRIELLRAKTDIGRYEGEYDRALADRKAPEARIAAASLAEAKARADLIGSQLARAEMRAPFDAVVIAGDLSQAIGAAVRRGEELYQIAPLESFRVQVEVPETDLDEIEVGQTGVLVLASLPGEEFDVRVTRITPKLEARDGLNVALVEAELLGDADQIRPGMRGVAKIRIEERLLIENWARPVIDWARLAFWRWTP